MLRTTRCNHGDDFLCFEGFRGISTEITLVHMGRESCKPYHVFSGTREEYIIHFVLSGRGFYSASGNTWPLSDGQIFLIQPNDTVVYCSDGIDPWRYAWIGFRGSETKSILKQCGFTKNNLVLPSPAPDEFMCCFDELFEHISMSYADGLYRESMLMKLLSILCRNYSQLSGKEDLWQNNRGGNPYVNQVIDYINEMYMNGISVADIAQHIGISQAHLNHIFQEELNLSVQNFLIDFRMYKAAMQLENTSLSIKEVSHLVGYRDPFVFSKAFKRKFEVSPKQYRDYEIKMKPRKKRP